MQRTAQPAADAGEAHAGTQDRRAGTGGGSSPAKCRRWCSRCSRRSASSRGSATPTASRPPINWRRKTACWSNICRRPGWRCSITTTTARATMAAHTRASALTVGLEGFGADLTAYNVVLGATGTGFDVRYGSNRFVGRWSPLLGKSPVVCGAGGAGGRHALRHRARRRAQSADDVAPLPGRMNPLNGSDGALLIDNSYSADPEVDALGARLAAHRHRRKSPRDLHLRRHGQPGRVQPARAPRRRAARCRKRRSVHHRRDGCGAGRTRGARSGHGRAPGAHHLQYAGRGRPVERPQSRSTSDDIVLIKGGAVGAHRTDHPRAAGERSGRGHCSRAAT